MKKNIGSFLFYFLMVISPIVITAAEANKDQAKMLREEMSDQIRIGILKYWIEEYKNKQKWSTRVQTCIDSACLHSSSPLCNACLFTTTEMVVGCICFPELASSEVACRHAVLPGVVALLAYNSFFIKEECFDKPEQYRRLQYQDEEALKEILKRKQLPLME